MADSIRNRDFEMFTERADQARAEANAASLANVRDRCLRAEVAWLEMAARAQRTGVIRATLLAAREAAGNPVPT